MIQEGTATSVRQEEAEKAVTVHPGEKKSQGF